MSEEEKEVKIEKFSWGIFMLEMIGVFIVVKLAGVLGALLAYGVWWIIKKLAKS